jgi:hypothetical protein
MRVVSIRLDDELYRQLRRRAWTADLSISGFLRPLIEDAALPGGHYVYTSNDEILGIAIQIFAVLTTMAGAQSPRLVEEGLATARAMLRDRGLLGPDEDSTTATGATPTQPAGPR